MAVWLDWLRPYDFSALTLLAFVLAAGLYGFGLRLLPAGERPGPVRQGVFWLGLLLCYAVMMTRFDYYAQYMFFVHRGQHLILHHLGPFLMAASNPLPVLRALYRHWRFLQSGFWMPVRRLYRLIQHPVVAPTLFVGLIWFWLWPAVHFDAMLSRDLYWVMNWSMLLDGLLFWWLMFDPRDPARAGILTRGQRILILALLMPPQIVLGAYITLSHGSLYDVYAVCGRAWPLAPETDQLLGGLLTWIPAAMMSLAGALVIFQRMASADRRPSPTSTAVS